MNVSGNSSTGGTTASSTVNTTTWTRDVRGLPVTETDANGKLIPPRPFALEPDTNSFYYAKNLEKIGSVCVVVGVPQQPAAVANPVPGTADKSLKLELRQPAVSLVEIRKYRGPNCSGDVLRKVTTQEVLVPQRGVPNYVFLPRAAAFGKTGANLTLSDAGTITKLKYGKTNGTASAINAFGSVADLADETRAEKVARLKSEADLIAAQERLITCQTSAKDCK